MVSVKKTVKLGIMYILGSCVFFRLASITPSVVLDSTSITSSTSSSSTTTSGIRYDNSAGLALQIMQRILQVLLLWAGFSNFLMGLLYACASDFVRREKDTVPAAAQSSKSLSPSASDSNSSVGGRRTAPTSTSLRETFANRVMKKRDSGHLRPLAVVLFWPWLLETYLVWFVKHWIVLRKYGSCAEVYRRYIVGRYPLGAHELPQGVNVVVDLTCEFPRRVLLSSELRAGSYSSLKRDSVVTGPLTGRAAEIILGGGRVGVTDNSSSSGDGHGQVKHRDRHSDGVNSSPVSYSNSPASGFDDAGCVAHYFCMPCLDMTMPAAQELLDVALQVREIQMEEDCKVYVHCANGHGRSSLFIILVMLLDGSISMPFEALAEFRKKRPKVGWQPAQEAAVLRAFELHQSEMKTLPRA